MQQSLLQQQRTRALGAPACIIQPSGNLNLPALLSCKQRLTKKAHLGRPRVQVVCAVQRAVFHVPAKGAEAGANVQPRRQHARHSLFGRHMAQQRAAAARQVVQVPWMQRVRARLGVELARRRRAAGFGRRAPGR